MRGLEMVAPAVFRAALAEPPLKEDPTSGQTVEQLPVYNAYSIDGDVTGELVYVNYGVPRDYDELDRHGIDVKGKVVLARYGGSWRGIKPKVAAEHGAIGCLIYSDPRPAGSERPGEWVIRGNHHDAWVSGAEDPSSGLVALLAEAKAVGALHKAGWTPKRTIVYAAWDGEEPGLLGSTEWAEAHDAELRQHAVAYLNSDSNGRGYFEVEGSHSLENFINGVEKDVADPEANVSTWKRNQLATIRRGTPEARRH